MNDENQKLSYIFPLCDRYSCKYILLAVHKIALASNEILNLFATKHFCLPSSKVFNSYISLISSMLKWQICRTNAPLHLYLSAVGLKSEVMKKFTPNLVKVHIRQLNHIRSPKSPLDFWPIIHFSVFPTQFWIFSKLCLVLSLGTLFTEIRQILAMFIFVYMLIDLFCFFCSVLTKSNFVGFQD